MIRSVAAFGLALLVSYLVTPLMRRLALRYQVVDRPNQRKVHEEPVPYLGGIAIYLGFIVALLAVQPLPEQLLVLLGGSTLILLLGVADDLWDLPAKAKFGGQVAIALLVALLGLRIQGLTNPLSGGYVDLGWWSIPLTVLWLVSLTNVMNLVDGLDGLAAGVAAIASGALWVVAMEKGQHLVALATLSLSGAAAGFLPHNFNPAKIFMGDAGSMFLGFTLAGIAVQGALKGAAAIALVIPVVALGVPVFDTACAIIRRFQNGQPIYEADREHVHHRLLALGLTPRQAVLVLYVLSLALGSAAVFISRLSPIPITFFVIVVAGALFLLAERIGVIKPVTTRGQGRTAA
ncbi:MAG: MraY family glycosyltransferase [Bacillota bacterium]|nr:MraY family glycosyltransferase [Bacillota bacterium]